MIADETLDLRWLSFPYNLLKVGMVLEEMSQGQILAITAETFAVIDLKKSLEKEGHKIRETEELGPGMGIVLWVEKGFAKVDVREA